MFTQSTSNAMLDMPHDMTIEKIILSKTLQSKMHVEVALVKHKKQYEAALFLDKRFKGGPPIPRPLESPSEKATHWMCARPRIGFTEEEAEKIIDEILSENRVKQLHFKDTWGAEFD